MNHETLCKLTLNVKNCDEIVWLSETQFTILISVQHQERMNTLEKFHSKRKFVSITPEGHSFEGYFLDYFRLKSEIKIPNSNIKVTVYGIEIEKRYSENGVEKLLEHARVDEIFVSSDYADSFIATLAKRHVTPSSLKYIVEDLLCENGYEPPEVT